MVEARWNGAVIARSDDTVVIEGNHYFPLEAIDRALLSQARRPASARGRARPTIII